MHKRYHKLNRLSGFTLIELSMVMVITALILGAMLVPLQEKLKESRQDATEELLHQVHEALIGFAIVNNRLPCPTTSGRDGNERTNGTGCVVQHGFIPMNTLGITGKSDSNGFLLDAWYQPIRYSVSSSNADLADGDLNWDFFVADGLNTVRTLQGDLDGLFSDNLSLMICDGGTGGINNACSGANPIVSETPAVFYSTGANYKKTPSDDELENSGTTMDGFRVGNDRVFASADYSTEPGSEFDDIIMWVSPNVLYLRLVQAGQL